MADEILSPGSGRVLPQKWHDNGDGSFSLVVYSTAAGGGAADREIVANHFRVTTAFTGASVGDVVTQLRVLDLTGTDPVQVGATIWFNDTTQLALASAPSAANLEPIGASGVTNAQLVAALATQTASINGTVLTNAQVVAALATQTSALNTNLDEVATDATVTSMSAKLPATLGAKASAAALAVVLATDDVQIGTKVTAVAALPTGGTGIIGWLSNIWSALIGLLLVDTLRQPLVARQLAAGATSANTTLTTTTRRISIYASGGNIRYLIGSASQTALVTSHFIAQGERLDLAVPTTPNIGVLRGGAADAVLELTELS